MRNGHTVHFFPIVTVPPEMVRLRTRFSLEPHTGHLTTLFLRPVSRVSTVTRTRPEVMAVLRTLSSVTPYDGSIRRSSSLTSSVSRRCEPTVLMSRMAAETATARTSAVGTRYAMHPASHQ